MSDFIFNLQRFAEVTILANETYALDGVTYTATQDAVLNLDDAGKVSGIASGKVSAVATGAESSPTVTFDATDGAINFKATGNGEIITVTTRPTIEFISGDFTYISNQIISGVGSVMRFVTNFGDYSFTNTVYVETGLTYTFYSNRMTNSKGRGRNIYVWSNGTETRQIEMVGEGAVIRYFAERGFTLLEGSSEAINVGDYTITATAVNGDAGINLEFSANGLNLVPNKNDGSLNVALSRGGQEIFAGDLQCTSGSITFGYDHAVTFAENTSFDFTWNDYVSRVTTTATATTDIALTDTGLSFTPHDGDGALNIVLYKNGTPVFGGALNVTGGTIFFDSTTQKFSFTEGTKIALAVGDGSREINFEIVNGDASFKVEADTSGNFTITPDTDDGSLAVTFKRNGKTTFQNTLSVNGSMIINPVTDLLTLVDGTTVNVAFKDYTLTATAQGDTASTVALTSKGIAITPQTGDGTLNLTLTGTSSGSLSANIEVLSGGFVFGLNGALTVTEGTELQVDFGDGYKVKFKATDAAGGAVTIDADGFTFAPASEDGGLELTITRDGETRSASLDVTGGSVTYKLDGSISLTKGTVVRNVFEGGTTLTITANTDASGSITFNPQTGLTIKPSTPDALNVVLTKDNLDTVISSINGIINYRGGIVTASDGTTANMLVHDTWEIKFSTEGGTASIQFTDDRTIYTAGEGATFKVDYLNGTTLEIENGTYSDIYATETSGEIGLISEGSTFRSNDNEEATFTLEKAGNYTLNGMNVTTTKDNVEVQLANYNTVTFGQDAQINIATTLIDKNLNITALATQGQGSVTVSDGNITYDATGGTLQVSVPFEYAIGESILNNTFDISGGKISFDTTNNKISCAAGSTLSFKRDEQIVTFTTTEDISATYKVEDEIYYLMLDDSITANVSITRGEQKIVGGQMEVGGVVSYRPKTGTFGLTGANSSHGDGTNTFLQFTIDGQTSTSRIETNDTTIVFIPNYTNGKFEVNFPNERKHAMKFTLTRDGQTVFENNIAIDGTVNFDTTNQGLSLTKDTTLTLTQGDNVMTITALDDAGGTLNIIDGGIRFSPNSGDGALELNFISTGRKALLNINGAVILSDDGKISLEDDTQVTFDWEDGTNLKLISTGSTGSIGFGEKGLQITSEDENLDIDLTTATGDQTHLSGIKGNIYYNAGKVLFDENSKITATTTLGGQPILITLETIGGTGHLNFNTSNGIIYSADTGAMKITWSKDDLESTFIVNSGSVQIGHGLFQISEGTNLATDLKNFVPTLYFTTSEAGTYTINGQTITTSAANLFLVATDDYMTFVTSDDLVTYDGMTFAGAGNVSLSSSIVALGAGVVATGFGKDKSFMLAEAGNVTVDSKIFAATSLQNKLGEDIPLNVSVVGAQDGFTFSRIITRQSEDYFNQPDYSNIGKIFREEFHAANDDSYRIETNPIGLQKIIGISDGTTINAAATFGSEPEETLFDVITETEGVFTVGDKSYTISGDSSVGIKADFEPDKSYVRGFDDLNGTVSGDFNDHPVTINGANPVAFSGGNSVEIVAHQNDYKIFGISNGESLTASLQGTYTIDGRVFELIEDVPKGITITGADDGFKIGSTDDSGNVFVENLTVTGDDTYTLQLSSLGLQNVLGISDGATIKGGATDDADGVRQGLYIYTQTEGSFTFGERTYNITGDSSVIMAAAFTLDEGYVCIFDDLSGNVTGNFTEHPVTINGGDSILINGDDSIDLLASDNGVELFNVSGGVSLFEMGGVSKVHTDSTGTFTFGDGLADTIAITILDDNNITFELNDDQFVKGINDIDGNILFSETNNYLSINGISGTFTGDFSSIGAYDNLLFIHDIANASTLETLDEDKIWLQMLGESFALNQNYLTLTNDADGIWLRDKEIVGLDAAASLKVSQAASYFVNQTTINANAGDVIIGGENSAYLYALNDNVTVTGTARHDTIYNAGSNVLFVYGGGNDIITGFNETSTLDIDGAIYSTVKSGSDVVLNLEDSKITLAGAANLDELNIEGTEIDRTGTKVTLTDSTPTPFTADSNIKVIDASKRTEAVEIVGNELGNSIISGAGADTIDAGKGSNFIQLQADEVGQTVVFNGGTLVENFGTGFDKSSDTVYIHGNAPGVDFKQRGLTFFGDGEPGYLTLQDVNETSEVNFYYAAYENELANHVFIADDDWYDASNYNFNTNKKTYFVGATAKPNHGIDFSGYIKSLNVMLDTYYETDTNFWIINVHSIIGGAGRTTITGSSESDTIIAGTGKTVIDAAGGNDEIILNDAKAKVKYSDGDGKDLITGFNANSSLEIAGDYYLDRVGDDVILTVGTGRISLQGAASLETLNIKKVANSENFNAKAITLTNFDAETFIAADKVKIIDAADRTKAIEIFGNDRANSIFGGTKRDEIYGGAGDDLIFGGKGNDSLWGDAGRDTFIYADGDGKDVIYGFENNDLLEIIGDFTTSYNSKKNEIAFNAGNGSITLKDFTATTFNVNGDKYKISGDSLVRK